MCRYSSMLHPKIYVPRPSPSKILMILHAICLISLMPCANLCLICCIWYVLYSNSQAMCHDSFMLCPFAYATYLYEWMLTDHIKNSLMALHIIIFVHPRKIWWLFGSNYLWLFIVNSKLIFICPVYCVISWWRGNFILLMLNLGWS